MARNKLTPTSYLVLGIVAERGPCTSYDLERYVAATVGNFWSFPHAQLYAEPAALAATGLLKATVERTGRRRRHYTVTRRGLAALQSWVAKPTDELAEIRDLALLRLFFAKQAPREDLHKLAQAQLKAHLAKLAEYRAQIRPAELKNPGIEPIHLGVEFEQTVISFWKRVALRTSSTRSPKAAGSSSAVVGPRRRHVPRIEGSDV